MIQPGRLADLVVLDRNYLTILPDDISELQPPLTVFDGKIVFVHSNFANESNLRPSGALVSTYKDLVARRRLSRIRGGGGG